MTTKPWVVATDLVAGYGDQPILGPTSFTIHTGVTALLGRNGGGKTTLMRTLCGIIPPLGGQCTVMGEPGHRRIASPSFRGVPRAPIGIGFWGDRCAKPGFLAGGCQYLPWG